MSTAFHLTSTYPHRVLTGADGSASLNDLGLCPSSQLLVVGASAAPGSGNPSAMKVDAPAEGVSVCERVMAWVFALLPGNGTAVLAPVAAEPTVAATGGAAGTRATAAGGDGVVRRRPGDQRQARFHNRMDGMFTWVVPSVSATNSHSSYPFLAPSPSLSPADNGESDRKQAYNGNSLQFEQ